MSETKPKYASVWRETADILSHIEDVLKFRDEDGRAPFDARCGVYVFYDFDGEPIYVGKTVEKLRARIRRHLTNQRTDAVAMSVLDPFEVAEVAVYPFFELEHPAKDESRQEYAARRNEILSRAEYTLYEKVRSESQVGETLNEARVAPTRKLSLPGMYRFSILPPELHRANNHPDFRIARRARTIAELAQVIVERKVSVGLRKTLITQAQRLEHLARQRFEELGGTAAVDAEGEEPEDY